MTIGERIHRERIRAGLSMKQLALKVGCNDASICNWEHNVTAPHLDKVCDLAQALRTTVEALCGRKEYCSSREVMELKRENVRLKNALSRIQQTNMAENRVIIEALFPDPLLEVEK